MEKSIIAELNEIKKLVKSFQIKKYLSIRELENYCGLSQSTIRREIQLGRLKVSRRKGKLLFSIESIDSWLNG